MISNPASLKLGDKFKLTRGFFAYTVTEEWNGEKVFATGLIGTVSFRSSELLRCDKIEDQND
jgi:hypothetical protein